MTPTERAAVAAAIAALEPFARAYDFVDDRIRGEPAFDYRGLLKAIKIGDFRRTEQALASLRALASVPSETVGRGEKLATDPAKVLPAATTTLPGAVGKKDPARKFKPRSAFDHIHALIKDGFIENARAVVEAQEQLTDEANAHALPTADRDAIREALKEALTYTHRHLRTAEMTDHVQAKLTAALVLIGEG